jgi:hypothetical protein
MRVIDRVIYVRCLVYVSTLSLTMHTAFILRTLNYDSARYGLAVTYDTKANISQGLVHGPLEGWEVNRLLTVIQGKGQSAAHPLLVPILAAEVATELSEVGIDGCDHVMMKMEYETGQHPYFQDQKDPLKIDFIPVTRKLNSNSTEVGILEMRVESLLLLFNDLDKTIDHIQGLIPASSTSRFAAESQALHEHIQYLRSADDNLLLRVHHIQRKAQTQLAVVNPPGLLYRLVTNDIYRCIISLPNETIN